MPEKVLIEKVTSEPGLEGISQPSWRQERAFKWETSSIIPGAGRGSRAPGTLEHGPQISERAREIWAREIPQKCILFHAKDHNLSWRAGKTIKSF